jgi:hypothetical protein
MSFTFPNAKVHTGATPDLTKTRLEERYGPGYQHIPGSVGVSHIGALPLALDFFNEVRHAEPFKSIFARAGHDGAEITSQERSDLHFLMDSKRGTTYARSILDAIAKPVAGQGSTTTAPHLYPGAPPLTGPGNVYDRIAKYGLIYGPTPLEKQKFYAEKYYENRLVPGVNEEEWMLSERGLRPLPEVAVVREDGLYLFEQLERKIAEWGLTLAADGVDVEGQHKAALDAYWAFEPAFVPASDEGASPSFGDRVCNPRSVLYAGRMIENAIVQGNPTAAAVGGPRCAITLGTPRHFSLFEAYGVHMTAAPLQSDEWRAILGQKPVGGSGEGLNVGSGRG